MFRIEFLCRGAACTIFLIRLDRRPATGSGARGRKRERERDISLERDFRPPSF